MKKSFNQKQNTNECATKEQEQSSRPRYKWLRVKDILLPKSQEEVDEKTVAAIAESIPVFGLLHPIAVRDAVGEEKCKGRKLVVLLAGANRLETWKRLGRKRIPCTFVDGDETVAQLVRLGENLFRKAISVLGHAEGMAEYFRLVSARISGQPGQKIIGRPPSGIAQAAREFRRADHCPSRK